MSLVSSVAKSSGSFSRAFAQLQSVLPYRKVGMDLLQDGQLNHGTGFSYEERDRFHLRGLLPHKVFTLDEQVARIKRQFEVMPTPLLKYIYLSTEREKNEHAFWRFLFTHPPEITMPVLYTPTVGEVCQKWASHRPSYRGIYISPNDSGHIQEILRNYPRQDIRCIVVTDGGRILGLGDLGAGGLGIPVGKLMLYTLIGQVPPQYTLPVQLDVGTDRKEILDDPLYHGWRHPRLRGDEHLKFVEEFVEAVKEVYGSTCLVQFEDFEMETAFRLLDHFRWRCNCFNDDIEGTAAVAAASVATAPRIKGVLPLDQQKYLFIGAGSAATGIANLIADIASTESGRPRDQILKNIVMFDAKGMVHAGRTDLFDFNKPFMHNVTPIASVPEAVRKLGITCIVGVSGCPGLITEEIVKDMCKNTERPLVLALSNPTSKAECSAEQAYKWSNEKALYASGSPFPDFTTKSGKKLVPSQANNSWIFPAVGHALVATRARHCPGKVFEVSAIALSKLVKPEDLEQSSLLPPLAKIREYALPVAVAVAQYLYDNELATVPVPQGMTLEQFIKSEQFTPSATYEPVY
ncbi:adhesin AP65-1 precursor [Tritrichomonas foetus]|uniref:Adhesin AP65-1 n=1 Tax=Tritrichomonas foetus TaxID=1144522 RepID=A0A1J4JSR1_9EUKA|nr:adhesin AP65-1 precursor [Tritrichomonas foetus]OHT00550.1 adhesin AP65-1 precursor [Tritrichomonas foetus]|eukprot:OHT00550.1 adhesin AP65-1 precursor [Tritrichomonas foetus]